MEGNTLPGVPIVESPFYERLSAEWDDETRRVGDALRRDGYAVIDFPEPDLDRLIADIQGDLGPRYDWAGWRESGWGKKDSLRIQDAWAFNASVKRLAANEHILALLSRLYGREAFPFQTLNFPVGTQQATHSDSTHFSSVPERFMCGVWLAFEDIDESNGGLRYYPGSHRLPIYTNEHVNANSATSQRATAHYQAFIDLWQGLISLHGIQEQRFFARKGQALIWAANLLHGGSEHLDPSRTRWSQVTHYYFRDCGYYTPITSDPFFGSTHYREPVDIATGKVVKNTYAGTDVPDSVVANGLANMRRFAPVPPKLPRGFNADAYLKANPDVAAAGVDAAEHWLAYGHREGRRIA
jgi:hypothetical protein